MDMIDLKEHVPSYHQDDSKSYKKQTQAEGAEGYIKYCWVSKLLRSNNVSITNIISTEYIPQNSF